MATYITRSTKSFLVTTASQSKVNHLLSPEKFFKLVLCHVHARRNRKNEFKIRDWSNSREFLPLSKLFLCIVTTLTKLFFLCNELVVALHIWFILIIMNHQEETYYMTFIKMNY